MARTKGAGRKGELGKQYREEAAARCLANGPGPSKRSLKRAREQAEAASRGETATTASGESTQPATKKAKRGAGDGGGSEKRGEAGEGDGEGADVESETLVVPAVLDAYPAAFAELIAVYDVTAMTIISSAKIQQKVARILERLSRFSFAGPCKPDVVFLRAKSKDAPKLITVVELVKRTLSEKGVTWYQYNCVDKRVEVKQRRGIGAEEGDGQDGFETLKTPLERALDERPVKKANSSMSICLSRVPVQNLKDIYGEQTNAVQ